MTAVITLTIAGADTGPFNIFSNVDNYVTAFETNISKTSLTQSFTSSNIPDATTIVRIKSMGACSNFIDIILPQVVTICNPSIITNVEKISNTQMRVTFNLNNHVGSNIVIGYAYAPGNDAGQSFLNVSPALVNSITPTIFDNSLIYFNITSICSNGSQIITTYIYNNTL